MIQEHEIVLYQVEGTNICVNPLYPEEDYEEFIARMIDEKKWKIERELDLI